jgi:hypothetical protein
LSPRPRKAGVYANIRRFLFYAVSGGTAEIAVMLAGPFVGLPLPLLPAQIASWPGEVGTLCPAPATTRRAG